MATIRERLDSLSHPWSSPCIGTCSTTYGDDMCRGCGRFRGEVSTWNGLTKGMRIQINERIRRQVYEAEKLHVPKGEG